MGDAYNSMTGTFIWEEYDLKDDDSSNSAFADLAKACPVFNYQDIISLANLIANEESKQKDTLTLGHNKRFKFYRKMYGILADDLGMKNAAYFLELVKSQDMTSFLSMAKHRSFSAGEYKTIKKLLTLRAKTFALYNKWMSSYESLMGAGPNQVVDENGDAVDEELNKLNVITSTQEMQLATSSNVQLIDQVIARIMHFDVARTISLATVIEKHSNISLDKAA